MDLNLSFDRKLQITGTIAIIIVAAINYLAHTPLKNFAALLGIVLCIYAARKLHKQFDVPLIFLRRNGANYWGGAFGALIGGISGYYGATRNFDKITLAEFGADLSLITIYLTLATLLFMGTVLKDIQDGCLEL